MRRPLFFALAGLAFLAPFQAHGQTPSLPIAGRGAPAPQTPPVPGNSLPGSLPPTTPTTAPSGTTPRPTAPEPAPQLPGNLLSFDPAQTEVQWQSSHWQLMAGNTLLKDFGRSEADARQAMRAVRELHLTQMGQLGFPRPVLEYWLNDGHAPQGLVSGLRTVNLDPGSLKVEDIQGQWCVRDNSRILFSFGSRTAEAQQALAILKRYGFTQVGYVGHGTPSMMIFLSNPTTPGPLASLPRPAPLAPRTTSLLHPAKPSQPDSTQQANASTPEAQGTATEAGNLTGQGQLASRVPPALTHGWQLSAPTVPPPGQEVPVDHIPFEWRQVQVRKDGQSWKLTSGTHTLASFGSDERAARLAQAAVQSYHLSEQCVIGYPQPCFAYFLSAGQPPRGQLFGTENVSFRSQDLVVRNLPDGWAICVGEQALFRFGNRPQEAQQALREIQKYHFDTACRVGHTDGASLTVLARAR